MIYLDHHATTPVETAVVEAMLPFFTQRYGNASSRQHALGQDAWAAVEGARGRVAALIGARAEDIVFTSGATESNNLALRGHGTVGHLVTTTIEHSAVLEPCRRLEQEGWSVTRVDPRPDGIVDVDAIAAALRPDTLLVSVMAANNEVGTIQPVAEIGRLCRERGVVFHCDGVQALGRIRVDVDEWGVDLLSLSAHKVYGPKGVGALYVRRTRRPRLRLKPLVLGGGQEKGLRSGTLNVPGIVGFGVAADLAAAALRDGEPERLLAMRQRLWDALQAAIDGVELNGAWAPRLPGNLHVSFEGAEAETLILTLGSQLAISSGAACAEAEGKGSHVLRALGLTDRRVFTSVRMGLGRQNSDPQMEEVVSLLAGAVAAARVRSAPARPR